MLFKFVFLSVIGIKMLIVQKLGYFVESFLKQNIFLKITNFVLCLKSIRQLKNGSKTKFTFCLKIFPL